MSRSSKKGPYVDVRLLARVEEVPFLRLRGAASAAAKLREHRAQALLCRQLTTIALDAPLADDGGHYRWARLRRVTGSVVASLPSHGHARRASRRRAAADLARPGATASHHTARRRRGRGHRRGPP